MGREEQQCAYHERNVSPCVFQCPAGFWHLVLLCDSGWQMMLITGRIHLLLKVPGAVCPLHMAILCIRQAVVSSLNLPGSYR